MPSTWYVLESTDTCACADQMPKGEKKIQPVAVPLDTLPERRTMTIHPEISARGSLIPAGDGSARCCRIPMPPGQGSEEGKCRLLDRMRQIPFLGSSVPPYTTLTKISTDIYLRM